MKYSRRQFLKLGAIAGAGLLPWQLDLRKAFGQPAVLTPFLDPLPIPTALPTAAQYQIRMTEFYQKLHANLPLTRVWGYNGTYPGPTIEARANVPIKVTWTNNLPTTHLLNDALDFTLHDMTGNPAVRTVVHLHGGHVTSQSDGGPMDWYAFGRLGDLRLPEHPAGQHPVVSRPCHLQYPPERLRRPGGLLPAPGRGRGRAQPVPRFLRDPARDPGSQPRPERPIAVSAVGFPERALDSGVLRGHGAGQRQGVALPAGRAQEVSLPHPERLQCPLLSPQTVLGAGLPPDRQRRRTAARARHRGGNPAGAGRTRRRDPGLLAARRADDHPEQHGDCAVPQWPGPDAEHPAVAGGQAAGGGGHLQPALGVAAGAAAPGTGRPDAQPDARRAWTRSCPAGS